MAWFATQDEASGVILMGDAVNVIIKGNEQHTYTLFDMDHNTGLLPGNKVHVNDIILKINRTKTPMVLRVKLDVSSQAQSLVSMIYDRMGIQNSNWHYYNGWYYYIGANPVNNSYVMVTPAEGGGVAGIGQIKYNGAVYATSRAAINPLDGGNIVMSSVWNTASDFEVVFSQTPTKSFRIPTDLTSDEIADEHLMVDITVEAIQDFIILDNLNKLPTIDNIDYLLYPAGSEGLQFAYVSGNKSIDVSGETTSYTLNGLDGYEVTGIGSANGDIVIPQFYNDGVHGSKPVIGIGESAISLNYDESAMLGNNSGRNQVNFGIFGSGDKHVTSVKLPDGLLYINRYGIYSNAITDIKLPNSVKVLGYGALGNEESFVKLKTLDLGTGLQVLGKNAFSMNYLSYLVLPASVHTSYWGAGSDEINTAGNAMTVVNLSSVIDDNLPKELKSTYATYAGATWSNSLQNVSVQVTPNKIIERVDASGNWIIGSADKGKKLYLANYTTGNWKITANAFNQSGYEQVTLGTGIAEIGKYAFANMRNLSSIKFVEGLTKIEGSAFRFASAGDSGMLKNIVLPNSLQQIDTYAFYNNRINNVKFGSGLTTIAENAFQYSDIISLKIPNNVTTLRGSAFSDNVNMTSIEIGNGLTTLEAGWFKNNVALKTVILGNGITSIPKDAFLGRSIETLILGSNVTSIGNNAFQNNFITSLVIPDKVTSIGNNAFQNNAIRTLKIGAKVNNINAYAFAGNRITSVAFNDVIKAINNNAFDGNELTSVTLPDSLSSVGQFAFANNKIKTVTVGSLPTGVVNLQNRAFYNNPITRVNWKATDPAASLISATQTMEIFGRGTYSAYQIQFYVYAANLANFTVEAGLNINREGGGYAMRTM